MRSWLLGMGLASLRLDVIQLTQPRLTTINIDRSTMPNLAFESMCLSNDGRVRLKPLIPRGHSSDNGKSFRDYVHPQGVRGPRRRDGLLPFVPADLPWRPPGRVPHVGDRDRRATAILRCVPAPEAG